MWTRKKYHHDVCLDTGCVPATKGATYKRERERERNKRRQRKRERERDRSKREDRNDNSQRTGSITS